MTSGRGNGVYEVKTRHNEDPYYGGFVTVEGGGCGRCIRMIPSSALVCRVGDAWTVEIQNRHACKMEEGEEKEKRERDFLHARILTSACAYVPRFDARSCA